MKKLLILLASIGLLYSCAQEAPQTSSSGGTEQPAAQSDGPSISLAFSADVETIDVIDGELQNAQHQARAVQASTQPTNLTHPLTLSVDQQMGADGAAYTNATMFIYDATGVARLPIQLKVTNGGRKLSFAGDLKVTTPGADKTQFDRMVANKLAGAKMSLFLGLDGNDNFHNKGFHPIDNFGATPASLPDDFVILSSEDNELTWKNDGSSDGYAVVAGTDKIRFKMRGYMLFVRIRNNFPALVDQQRMEDGGAKPSPRPGIFLQLIVSPSLSAAYQMQVSRTAPYGFVASPAPTNEKYLRTTNLFSAGPSYTSGGQTLYRYLAATNTEQKAMPVNSKLDSNGDEIAVYEKSGSVRVNKPAFDRTRPANDETVFALYCPNPNDAGSISYIAPTTGTSHAAQSNDYYYNGNIGSQYKTRPYLITGNGSAITKSKSNVAGKAYFVILNVAIAGNSGGGGHVPA